MIKACDAAYDRAKLQTKMAESRAKNAKKATPPVAKAPQKPFTLHLDADKLRLSHIIELKKVFRAHPGETPIAIEILKKSGKVGKIEIESSWGVKFSQPFEEKLRKFPPFVDIIF